jgi:hypothetical protein
MPGLDHCCAFNAKSTFSVPCVRSRMDEHVQHHALQLPGALHYKQREPWSASAVIEPLDAVHRVLTRVTGVCLFQVANFFGGLGNSVYVGSGGGAFYQNYNFAVRTFSNSTTPFFSKRTWLEQGHTPVYIFLVSCSELILVPLWPYAVTIDGLGIRGGPSRGNFTVSSPQRHH